MRKKQFDENSINALCPMSRALKHTGEAWTALILRDAIDGLTRFDEFEKSLSIAPTVLTRRLTTMVEDGLFERHQYCEHPPRFEYILTGRGRDFRQILLSLMTWGTKHFSPEGEMLVLIDRNTGLAVQPVLVDRQSGKLINQRDHRVVAGPAASEGMKLRMALRGLKQEQQAN